MIVTQEEQARKAFADKLAKTDGLLFISEERPFELNRPEKIDFDVLLPDGSIYILRDIPCAAIREATRDEWMAGVRAWREVGPDEIWPDATYYYVLSFD